MKTVIKGIFIGIISIVTIFLLFGNEIMLYYKEIKDGLSSTLIIPTVNKIKVEIKGAVHRPGVYTVAEGTTLWDIVSICGLKDTADTSSTNFAQKLCDEEVYFIPYLSNSSSTTIQQTISTPDKENSSSPSESLPKKININTASFEELLTLNGIGEAKANKILTYLESGKKINSYEELVSIIGGLKSEYLEEIKSKTVLE